MYQSNHELGKNGLEEREECVLKERKECIMEKAKHILKNKQENKRA